MFVHLLVHSPQNRILIFWANMTNTCRSKANLLKLFMFLTIYGSKSNYYATLMYKTRIRWIKICLTIRKWPNIILPKCYSIFALIFALRLNTLTSNYHFFLLLLLFDLGYRGLLLTLMTNVEAGLRFTGIWWTGCFRMMKSCHICINWLKEVFSNKKMGLCLYIHNLAVMLL